MHAVSRESPSIADSVNKRKQASTSVNKRQQASTSTKTRRQAGVTSAYQASETGARGALRGRPRARWTWRARRRCRRRWTARCARPGARCSSSRTGAPAAPPRPPRPPCALAGCARAQQARAVGGGRCRALERCPGSLLLQLSPACCADVRLSPRCSRCQHAWQARRRAG